MQEERVSCGGTLVLALTGVVDLHLHTGGSFTSSHLASSFQRLDS